MATNQKPLTPSAVGNYIKSLLEGDIQLKKLYIAGEVSNVKYHSNGNIYFNIKDEMAQINCLMFKNYKNQMTFKLLEGDKVEILGNIYSYVKMGQISINIFKIRKMGQGDLFQKYLELKNTLDKKGYFDEKNKKPIPEFPKKIGVLTSDTGAAIRDIITTIKRRAPQVKIYVIPTLVQGTSAHTKIAANIDFAQNFDFDILIVGRGGGSIEDLWAFNEEDVAISIHRSKIPVISAVGHESDFTIADFVADKRAPTPTAAAEMATSDTNELKNNLNKNKNMLKSKLLATININQEKLKAIKNNQYFINPLLNTSQDFMFLQDRFLRLVNNFGQEITLKKDMLDNLNQTNINQINLMLKTNKDKIEHQKENLDNLNPLTILSKGYAAVKKENEFIKTIKDIKKDDNLNIKLKDGEFLSKVINIKSTKIKE